MATRRSFLAVSTAFLVVPLPAWASTSRGYVRFTNIASGKAAPGNATEVGRHEDPVDDAWFEPMQFEFGLKRDVASGARSTGNMQYDRVRMVTEKSAGTRMLKEWSENEANVRCELMLFNGKDSITLGEDSTGRLFKVEPVESKEAQSKEPLVELHYAYHSVSCEDLIRSKAAQWSWATRTQ
jgi:hypothetical protein